MKCLYVCIKDVLDKASGYDYPVYVKWPVGSIAWFPKPPNKEYWKELGLFLHSPETGIVFTQGPEND